MFLNGKDIKITFPDNDFFESNLKQQKILIDNSFKECIINILDNEEIVDIEDLQDLDVENLLILLEQNLKNKDKRKIDNFMYCLLGLIAFLQNHNIEWKKENDPLLLKGPVLETNENLWTVIKTHEDMPPISSFLFFYNLFQTTFETENSKLIKF